MTVFCVKYARYYFLCVEFSDFYVNQSLAGQTIPPLLHRQNKVTLLRLESMVRAQ
jgi:hypothetical protein